MTSNDRASAEVDDDQGEDYDDGPEPHEADGEVVVTVIGSDGVRWACRTCGETVYMRGDRFLHFRTELNLPDPAPAEASP